MVSGTYFKPYYSNFDLYDFTTSFNIQTMNLFKNLLWVYLISCLAQTLIAQSSILLFVSHEDTYYTEYIVMKEALETAGYIVDVRSASTMDFSIYMVSSSSVQNTANSLSTSNYSEFQTQFQDLFGGAWDTSQSPMPSFASPDGRIQDVPNMDAYAALVVVGGTGAIDYRVDDAYATQGTGARQLSAATVQETAEKLNELAIEAVLAGKPVMAQCHGASIPAFWRIPGTSGAGIEAIGFSLLKGGEATGFPEAATGPTLTSLDVNYRPMDRVVVSSPHPALSDLTSGDSQVITTRDWYPQTVAYAARTLINILESYLTVYQRELPVSTLLLHGGALDPSNCGAGNQANDVPCNYGGGANLPADYTHLEALLLANSTNDNFTITVTEVDITAGGLPYDPNDAASILSYLEFFDTVIFYKHWSTSITSELLEALVTYADNGGGVVALHHALYNHNSGGQNKDILVNDLFGIQSPQPGWSGNLANYDLISTNHGHFITTYGLHFLPNPVSAPANWGANPLMSVANHNYFNYSRLEIYDEYYGNMQFVAGETFGRNVGDITLLYSNDINSTIAHTSGCLKLFNPSADASIGRAVCFQVGERTENYDLNHDNGEYFGQVIRNAVIWAGENRLSATNLQISVFLQGAHNGTDMGANLTGLIPFNDPYGLGVSVSSIPLNVVDWLQIEVRDAGDNTNILASKAAFLRKDGVVLDLDGEVGVTFTGLNTNSAYIVVKHRNHLGVMTQTAVGL